MSPKDPQQDPTAAFDTTKRTSSPNKHKGRKIAVICGVFVVVVGAAAIWATSADDDKPNADKPLGDVSTGVSTPSPEKTFDGRYTKYDGTGFAPNLQATLNCKNNQPSSSVMLLVRQYGTDQSAADVMRITPLQAEKPNSGCLWLLETPNNAWYKETVSYSDTSKGYWKITRQEQNSGNAHVIRSGPNTTTQVLVQWGHLTSGPVPDQFYDLKLDAPGSGPDALKLPKPPRNSSASPSPTTTP